MHRTHVLAAPLLVLALGLATGCSDQDQRRADREIDQARESAQKALEDLDLPDVDWSAYGERTKERVERAAADADCSELEDELAKAEANDTDLTDYLKSVIRQVC